MGWGGARIGAGRKPKRDKPLELVDGRAAFSTGPDLSRPPEGLPADQAAFWREYAPLAVDQRTLIAATVPAFRRLCDLEVKRERADKKAAEGGVSEMRVYLQLVKQVEGLMARFRLAPFGKAIAPAPRSMGENPMERYLSALSGRKQA